MARGIVQYVAEPLIRVARAADVPEIARLHLASYRAAYQDLLPAGFLAGLTLADRDRRWRASLGDRARETFMIQGAEAGTMRLPGFAEIGPCRDDGMPAGTGELIALHVTEGRWRQGVGRRLHAHALAALATRGFGAAMLWVLSGNGRAQAFYAAMGWSADGRAREFAMRGISIPEIRYRIRIG